MKDLFLAEAKANKALPIGGGLWTRFHPEDAIGSPYKSWRFDATTNRMPEFTAPASASGATTSPSMSRSARRRPGCCTPSAARAAA